MTYKSAFDPENDPIVYTTDDGVEIRYANTLTNSNLAGYTYFTMGQYEGIDVNWVIIGYDPSLNDLVGEYSGLINKNPTEGDNNQFSTIDKTPAGTAILKDMFAISNLAVANDEIGDGCMLCLSECGLGSAMFNSNNNNYEKSALQTKMQEFYDSTLNLSAEEKMFFKPQTLTNYYLSTSSESENQLFFPLAGRGENFNFSSYLYSEPLRCCYSIIPHNDLNWRLRSGGSSNTYCCVINPSGVLAQMGNITVTTTMLRPAFVFELL